MQHVYAISCDIQLHVCTVQTAENQKTNQKTSKAGKADGCQKIYHPGKIEIVSKIMYIGLGDHIVWNAHQ